MWCYLYLENMAQVKAENVLYNEYNEIVCVFENENQN